MKRTSKSLLLLAAAVLTTTVLKADDKPATANNAAAKPAEATRKTDDLFGDPVLAKGKGVEIKLSALDNAIAGIRASANAHRQQISPGDMPMIKRSSFDHLLQVQLLLAKANDADRAAGKVEGDKRIEMIRKRAPSPEMLATQLKSLNMTVDGLHAKLIEEATAEAVLRAKVKVTDADIKEFYNNNQSKFEESEKVRASHILIATGDPRNPTPMSEDEKKAKRKLAEEVLVKAKKGEDFAKLAKQYSEDPGSKDTGGEYTFGHGDMVKEFETAAFSLKTNQISDIVTTAFGYHIIKLNEKFPAKKHELAEVTPDIKSYLERLQMEKMLPDYYTALKKEANVEILDKEIKALEDMPLDLPGVPPTGGLPPTAPPAAGNSAAK